MRVLWPRQVFWRICCTTAIFFSIFACLLSFWSELTMKLNDGRTVWQVASSVEKKCFVIRQWLTSRFSYANTVFRLRHNFPILCGRILQALHQPVKQTYCIVLDKLHAAGNFQYRLSVNLAVSRMFTSDEFKDVQYTVNKLSLWVCEYLLR